MGRCRRLEKDGGRKGASTLKRPTALLTRLPGSGRGGRGSYRATPRSPSTSLLRLGGRTPVGHRRQPQVRSVARCGFVFTTPSQMGEYARRAGGGPSGAAGRKRRWKPASSALSRPLRRCAPPPRRGAAGRRRARPCQRPARGRAWRTRRASPDLGSVGRGGGAERGPGGPGDRWVCGSFGSRRCNAPRSRLDGGPCQRGLSPLCRMPYATPGARHACAPGSPDAHPAGAGASDAPADPAVFFSPQANTRPTHPRGRLGRGSKTPSPRRGVEAHYAPGRKGR